MKIEVCDSPLRERHRDQSKDEFEDDDQDLESILDRVSFHIRILAHSTR